jgi:hypothetical protein
MSTYINFRVKSRDDLKNWIAGMLGHPLITIEITDTQLDICVDNAVEEYSKYAIHEEDYYAVDLKNYQNADPAANPPILEGIKLPEDIIGIFTFNDDMISQHNIGSLFSVPNAMWNAGMMPSQMGMGGGSWVTYHMALGYMKFVKQMMGGGFQFEYNRSTKMLKLFPNPLKERISGSVVLGCYVMRPEDQQYGESWVRRYALAQAKIIIGTVRNKFNGTTLIGGGTLDIGIKEEGVNESKELMDALRAREMGPCGFFIGAG